MMVWGLWWGKNDAVVTTAIIHVSGLNHNAFNQEMAICRLLNHISWIGFNLSSPQSSCISHEY